MGKVRGYDTPQLYREDTIERNRQLERDCNDSAKRMNRIIKEGRLPEKLVPLPFPEAEDDDSDCE
jgi:hypothetical protein